MLSDQLVRSQEAQATESSPYKVKDARVLICHDGVVVLIGSLFGENQLFLLHDLGAYQIH